MNQTKNTLIVTYDLRKPGRDYQSLYDTIKSNGTWAKLTESVWLLKSANDAAYWRDKLKACIDANDELAVLTSKSGWATYGIDSQITDWMKNNI